MSRVGKQSITVPSGVTLKINPGSATVTGPKGELSVNVPSGITVTQNEQELLVTRENEEKKTRSSHGLVRSLLSNSIQGVTEGFKKQLEVNGVGFKVAVQGKTLKLALGLSHDVMFDIPEDLDISADKNLITIQGNDRQRVGQIAAEIRALKKPEPYKGKGIKYIDEHIVRKAGKTAGGGE